MITNPRVVHKEHPKVVLRDARKFSANVLARSKALDITGLSINAERLKDIPEGNFLDAKPWQWWLESESADGNSIGK